MIKLIFLTVLSWNSPEFPADSLRTETINGKVFIIHQVVDKETLYGISRRYAVPIAGILDANPTADAGLEVGQLLKVPYIPKSKVRNGDNIVHKVLPKETLFSISRLYNVSVDDIKSWNKLTDNGLSTGQELMIRKSTGTKNTNEAVTKNPATTDGNTGTNGRKIHVVEAKETLFAISKKYGVTMQQLREWNGIQGSDVKVGDVLMIAPPKGYTTTEPKPETIKEEVKPLVREEPPIKEDPKPVVTEENKPLVSRDNSIVISESVRGSDEVREGGLAELIEGTEGNRKYLALHKNAKVGTILKVRNELNNREVFVRVVGSLPPTSVNDKVIIKISKSAYDRLGAIDPKFRAEVTYYK